MLHSTMHHVADHIALPYTAQHLTLLHTFINAPEPKYRDIVDIDGVKGAEFRLNQLNSC